MKIDIFTKIILTLTCVFIGIIAFRPFVEMKLSGIADTENQLAKKDMDLNQLSLRFKNYLSEKDNIIEGLKDQIRRRDMELYNLREKNNNVENKISNEKLKDYLSDTVSKDSRKRKYAIQVISDMLDFVYHDYIIVFYINYLEHINKKLNSDAVYNTAMIISKLDSEMIKKYQEKLKKIYEDIYGLPEWKQTSKLYDIISSEFDNQSQLPTNTDQ
ncbi:hypothetical protein GMMP15_560004 [Candidatus Magnetomoraceae bacterium gMMP-15]